MKKYWWKIVCVVLLVYTFTAGFLAPVPRLDILNETIRNLYFHVPMWFGMTFVLAVSFGAAIAYLVNNKPQYDFMAVESVNTGIFFGVLGLLTGMMWAKITWNAYWTPDPKLNASAVGMLIYLAYIVLRGSLKDEQQRGRISAVYNIFAFPIFIALIYVMPRLTDSLHPGNGSNVAFSKYDLNSNMRMVFYPAVVGFILLGVWITSLRVRLRKINLILEDQN